MEPLSSGTPSQEADRTVGRYRRIASLGQGGMADVWLAAAQGLAGFSKLLVIKELKKELVEDAEFVTMFLDEARLAARLNHTNIVQTYEVGVHEQNQQPYIVMEWLDGQPLHAIIGRVKRQNIPIPITVAIFAKVLAALEYAHTIADFDGTPLSIVHRDISPQNIFVTYEGATKIVDFGIARAAGSASQTRTGLIKGKLGYMAPEQLTGHDLDHRADIFPVGVMLWEALVGRRLTQGDGQVVTMEKRAQGMHPGVLEAAPDAPPELAAITDRAMALEPDARYADAREMRVALEGWLAKYPTSERDVATFVAAAFTSERAKIKEIIEREVAGLRDRASYTTMRTGQLPVLGAFEPTPSSSLTQRANSQPPSSSVQVLLPSTASAAPPSPAPPSRALPIVLGVALVIAILVPIGLHFRGGPGGVVPAAAAPIASNPAPVVPASAVTAAPTASAEPALAPVRLTVSAAPKSATISLDGAVLEGNPFSGAFPASTVARIVEVSAPGYASEQRAIVLNQTMVLDLVLKRGRSGAGAGRPAAAADPGAAPLGKKSRPGGQRPIDEDAY